MGLKFQQTEEAYYFLVAEVGSAGEANPLDALHIQRINHKSLALAITNRHTRLKKYQSNGKFTVGTGTKFRAP